MIPARELGSQSNPTQAQQVGQALGSLLQVGVIGEGEEWLLIYQLSNEPDARSMEVPDLNPFTYYR